MKKFVIYRQNGIDVVDQMPTFEVLKVTQSGLKFVSTNNLSMGQYFTQEEVDCIGKFLPCPFITTEIVTHEVDTNAMKMFAIQVEGKYVTYGEFHEYILEDVSLEEAAYFDEEQVQTVVDYFEPKVVTLVEIDMEEVSIL